MSYTTEDPLIQDALLKLRKFQQSIREVRAENPKAKFYIDEKQPATGPLKKRKIGEKSDFARFWEDFSKAMNDERLMKRDRCIEFEFMEGTECWNFSLPRSYKDYFLGKHKSLLLRLYQSELNLERVYRDYSKEKLYSPSKMVITISDAEMRILLKNHSKRDLKFIDQMPTHRLTQELLSIIYKIDFAKEVFMKKLTDKLNLKRKGSNRQYDGFFRHIEFNNPVLPTSYRDYFWGEYEQRMKDGYRAKKLTFSIRTAKISSGKIKVYHLHIVLDSMFSIEELIEIIIDTYPETTFVNEVTGERIFRFYKLPKPKILDLVMSILYDFKSIIEKKRIEEAIIEELAKEDEFVTLFEGKFALPQDLVTSILIFLRSREALDTFGTLNSETYIAALRSFTNRPLVIRIDKIYEVPLLIFQYISELVLIVDSEIMNINKEMDITMSNVASEAFQYLFTSYKLADKIRKLTLKIFPKTSRIAEQFDINYRHYLHHLFGELNLFIFTRCRELHFHIHMLFDGSHNIDLTNFPVLQGLMLAPNIRFIINSPLEMIKDFIGAIDNSFHSTDDISIVMPNVESVICKLNRNFTNKTKIKYLNFLGKVKIKPPKLRVTLEQHPLIPYPKQYIRHCLEMCPDMRQMYVYIDINEFINESMRQELKSDVKLSRNLQHIIRGLRFYMDSILTQKREYNLFFVIFVSPVRQEIGSLNMLEVYSEITQRPNRIRKFISEEFRYFREIYQAYLFLLYMEVETAIGYKKYKLIYPITKIKKTSD